MVLFKIIARPRKHKSSADDTREALAKHFISKKTFFVMAVRLHSEMTKTVFFKTI